MFEVIGTIALAFTISFGSGVMMQWNDRPRNLSRWRNDKA